MESSRATHLNGTPMSCDVLTDADVPQWEEFAARAQCGIYHHLGWRNVIEAAYGHRAPYLVAKRAGKVTGVLPLVAVRSRLFGKSLTSLPFLDFAGTVADDEDSHAALVTKALELGRELEVDYVELRQIAPRPGHLATSTHKVLMTLELESTEDRVWSKLSSERRNRVRRAQKEGLTVEVGGASMLPVFYDIWTRNMRDLGSPPHSRKFFAKVLERFGDSCSILLVRRKDDYVGAALTLFSKDTMSVPWVSSLREHFQLYPNNVLYWEAIRLAVAKGLKTFDFGRSTLGSGTFEFKQRWGAVATPLHWQFLPVRRAAPIPSADGGGFGLAVELWKRIPVPITRLLGPALRKNITA
jgi:FemAB-related protein (PEP-CTERM system-associated)